MYFQPIKNEDPRLDFYTMYKREATEYDTESMRKHNEDLNTTLIFVRFRFPLSRTGCLPRPQAGLRSSNQIPASVRKHISARSFSASTDPSRPTNTLRFLLRGTVLLRR